MDMISAFEAHICVHDQTAFREVLSQWLGGSALGEIRRLFATGLKRCVEGLKKVGLEMEESS